METKAAVDKVIYRLLGWCQTGHHDECKREYQRFYIDPKGKAVFYPELVKCACKKRGCACYTKPAERPTPVKKATRRKK